MNIKLIVCDWEGCVTEPGGGTVPWPTSEVAALSDLINQMRAKGYPPLVLCSGRQFPYGEAALQAINAFWNGMPSILENGVGLYYPTTKAFERHPLISSVDETTMDKIRRTVREAVNKKEGRQRELGKEYCISVNPAPGETVISLESELQKDLQKFLPKVELSRPEKGEFYISPNLNSPNGITTQVSDLQNLVSQLAQQLDNNSKVKLDGNKLVLQAEKPALLRYSLPERLCDKLGASRFHSLFGHIEMTHSESAVDITPSGINKGAGAIFLAERTSIKLDEMVGIGDSSGDLPMLELVGYPAAPANANARVRGLANYCSPYRTTRGVMDIIEHYCPGIEVQTELRWQVSVQHLRRIS